MSPLQLTWAGPAAQPYVPSPEPTGSTAEQDWHESAILHAVTWMLLGLPVLYALAAATAMVWSWLFGVVGWFAVIGPNKMPEPVVTQLRTALEAVRKNPEFRKAVEAVGYTVDDGIGATELAARIDREYKMWQGVVDKGNIQSQ